MLELKVFNAVFSKYYNPFLKFANSYVRDEAIAEEIVAESFTLLWENRESISADTNLPAYLLTIIKNLSLNHLKRLSLRRNITDTIQQVYEWDLAMRINSIEACDPSFLFPEEIKTMVGKAIEKLPSKTREVFILSRIKSKNHKEIAEKLKITTKGVEYHITKAISTLKIELKDYLLAFLFFLFFF